jgi:membrane protease YdiL (CAAX protease family)
VITPLKAGLISGAPLIIVAIATAICGLLERRRITDYSLNGLGRLSLFAKGSFWGIFFITLLVETLDLTHHLTFEVDPEPLKHNLKYGLGWFISMLFIGMFEEMLLRGYPQWTSERGRRNGPCVDCVGLGPLCQTPCTISQLSL